MVGHRNYHVLLFSRSDLSTKLKMLPLRLSFLRCNYLMMRTLCMVNVFYFLILYHSVISSDFLRNEGGHWIHHFLRAHAPSTSSWRREFIIATSFRYVRTGRLLQHEIDPAEACRYAAAFVLPHRDSAAMSAVDHRYLCDISVAQIYGRVNLLHLPVWVFSWISFQKVETGRDPIHQTQEKSTM